MAHGDEFLEPSTADTLRFRVEAGMRSDWTTEQFYEETFTDTTFLARRLVATPETRIAGALSTLLAGTRSGRRQSFQLGSDLILGDRLSRGVLHGTFRHDADSWRWTTIPRAEYERDRTFERDLERVRISADTRLRRGFGDGVNRLETGAGGEFMRARGEGSQFLLDRDVVRSTLGFEHAPVTGAEWRIAWLFAARVFADSVTRDHLEHGWDGHVRRDFEGGHFVMAETHGARRTARHPAPDTRDRFVEADVAAEGTWRLGTSWAGAVRAGFETLRYDEPDSAVFFDYGIARAQITPRFEHSSWTIAAGPRVEVLDTALGPLEEYRELSAIVEFEGLLPGTWWSVVPEYGWREYRISVTGVPVRPEEIGAHSSYRFVELNVYADQRIPGGIRARLLGSGRYEAHTQAADDSRSLYISFDVRKIF